MEGVIRQESRHVGKNDSARRHRAWQMVSCNMKTIICEAIFGGYNGPDAVYYHRTLPLIERQMIDMIVSRFIYIIQCRGESSLVHAQNTIGCATTGPSPS